MLRNGASNMSTVDRKIAILILERLVRNSSEDALPTEPISRKEWEAALNAIIVLVQEIK
jgi:hypothetical protein